MSDGSAPPRTTVADGDTVVFLGDSLTDDGCRKRDGWVRQVVAGLSARGVRIRPVCAGVPGDRSIDMLARFDADVLTLRPEWLVLSCGVNDVWHGERGCTVAQLRGSVAAMLEGARTAGVSVLCTTATVVGEDLDAPLNRALVTYNGALRELAATNGLLLADCSAAFHDALRAPGAVAGTWLTVDGIHFNARGEATMARAVLRAWVAVDP